MPNHMYMQPTMVVISLGFQGAPTRDIKFYLKYQFQEKCHFVYMAQAFRWALQAQGRSSLLGPRHGDAPATNTCYNDLHIHATMGEIYNWCTHVNPINHKPTRYVFLTRMDKKCAHVQPLLLALYSKARTRGKTRANIERLHKETHVTHKE